MTQKTLAQKDDFNENKLGFEWNYLNNPIESNYSLSTTVLCEALCLLCCSYVVKNYLVCIV